MKLSKLVGKREKETPSGAKQDLSNKLAQGFFHFFHLHKE